MDGMGLEDRCQVPSIQQTIAPGLNNLYHWRVQGSLGQHDEFQLPVTIHLGNIRL